MPFGEYLTELIVAIATLITAVGGLAVYNGRKETKNGEGPSQAAVLKRAIDENTASNLAIGKQMAENLRHFEKVSMAAINIERTAGDTLATLRSVDRELVEIRAKLPGK